MAVRNFWLEADIDGRRTDLAGGPRAKDGGFSATVFVRQHGSIAKALTISGFTGADGQLRVDVRDGDGKELTTIRSER